MTVNNKFRPKDIQRDRTHWIRALEVDESHGCGHLVQENLGRTDERVSTEEVNDAKTASLREARKKLRS